MPVAVNEPKRGWTRSLLCLAIAAGCGGATERPQEIPFTAADAPTSGSAAATPTGVRSILMLVPSEPDDQVVLWQQAVRDQAGQQKVLVGVETYDADNAESLTSSMEAASTRGAGVVILVPPQNWKDGDRQAALAAAESQDIKVVILGRPVAGLVSSSNVKQVLLAPQSSQAEQLVEAALQKASERPEFKIAEGPALIIVNPGTKGPWVAERAEGFREALEKHQIPMLDNLLVTAPGKPALEAIRAALEAEDGPTLILAADVWTLKATAAARQILEKPESVILAGFADDTSVQGLILEGAIDASINSKLFEVGQDALAMAAALLKGREVVDRVELPTPTRLSDRLPLRLYAPTRNLQPSAN